MLINHRKIANATVRILEILAEEKINQREIREISRAVIAVAETQELSNTDFTETVHQELCRRYNDEQLDQCTEWF